jgi:hypothetical protein
MKKFKYKFSKLITILIFVGLAFCIVGFCLNLYLNITNGTSSAADPIYPIIQYTLLYFVTVVLFVLLVSFLVKSYYAVTEKYFITNFGFVKSKYNIELIETISLDRTTNKLAITFEDTSFINVVVNETWYNDFVDALLAANPKIEYSIISKDGDKTDGKEN